MSRLEQLILALYIALGVCCALTLTWMYLNLWRPRWTRRR